MAIIFLEEKNRKKHLYLFVGGLIVIFLALVVYFNAQKTKPLLSPITPKRIIIDWGVLNHPVVRQLKLPPEIPETLGTSENEEKIENKEKLFRDNPFEMLGVSGAE
ncbi:hypothetical protein J7K92_02485 [bacterium]|nr:hypothetical protein [bacterium]